MSYQILKWGPDHCKEMHVIGSDWFKYISLIAVLYSFVIKWKKMRLEFSCLELIFSGWHISRGRGADDKSAMVASQPHKSWDHPVWDLASRETGEYITTSKVHESELPLSVYMELLQYMCIMLNIITWLCDILALVWHFGPACVTFRPGLCDILALSCVTKASACHHTPILTTGAVYRKFHRSSVSKTT